jgi:hypothetical protein
MNTTYLIARVPFNHELCGSTCFVKWPVLAVKNGRDILLWNLVFLYHPFQPSLPSSNQNWKILSLSRWIFVNSLQHGTMPKTKIKSSNSQHGLPYDNLILLREHKTTVFSLLTDTDKHPDKIWLLQLLQNLRTLKTGLHGSHKLQGIITTLLWWIIFIQWFCTIYHTWIDCLNPPYLIFLTYGSCNKGEIHLWGRGMWSFMTPIPCLPPPQVLRMDHMNPSLLFSAPPTAASSLMNFFFTKKTDMCTCRMLSVTHQAAKTYTPRTVCLSLLFCPTSGLSKTPLIQFPWEDLYQRDTHMHRMLT